MNKVLKNIVDGAIENEFQHVQDKNLKDMVGLKEYEELGARCGEIYDILKDHLPEEYHDLLSEFDDKKTYEICFEIRHYFRKGVKAGFTNLKYLEEAEAEIIML
jgi:hypothetical protein